MGKKKATSADIADPSVCTRCSGGAVLPGGMQPICLLCALAEQYPDEVEAA